MKLRDNIEIFGFTAASAVVGIFAISKFSTFLSNRDMPYGYWLATFILCAAPAYGGMILGIKKALAVNSKLWFIFNILIIAVSTIVLIGCLWLIYGLFQGNLWRDFPGITKTDY